jgi:hypothetical protein
MTLAQLGEYIVERDQLASRTERVRRLMPPISKLQAGGVIRLGDRDPRRIFILCDATAREPKSAVNNASTGFLGSRVHYPEEYPPADGTV